MDQAVRNEKIERILNHWFGDNASLPQMAERNHWWRLSPRAINQIHENFYGDLQLAKEGQYDHWLEQANGSLAFNLLLHFASRTIFQGEAQAYQYDTLATQNTLAALKMGHDLELEPLQRLFLYTPLKHSEHIEHITLYLNLVQTLLESANGEWRHCLEWSEQAAKQRRRVLQQFHRLPHRHTVLNRTATKEEAQFLRSYPRAPYYNASLLHAQVSKPKHMKKQRLIKPYRTLGHA